MRWIRLPKSRDGWFGTETCLDIQWISIYGARKSYLKLVGTLFLNQFGTGPLRLHVKSTVQPADLEPKSAPIFSFDRQLRSHWKPTFFFASRWMIMWFEGSYGKPNQWDFSTEWTSFRILEFYLVIVLISLIIPLVYLQLLQIHQGFLSRFSPTFAVEIRAFCSSSSPRSPIPPRWHWQWRWLWELAPGQSTQGVRPGISGYLLALL